MNVFWAIHSTNLSSCPNSFIVNCDLSKPWHFCHLICQTKVLWLKTLLCHSFLSLFSTFNFFHSVLCIHFSINSLSDDWMWRWVKTKLCKKENNQIKGKRRIGMMLLCAQDSYLFSTGVWLIISVWIYCFVDLVCNISSPCRY